jgi:uncharacterized glyoxalase superfamily protein PhnB
MMEAPVVTNRSAPAATIVPILIYEDVGHAIDWLCRVFGFTERLRAERDGIVGHAQLSFGNGAVMLGRHGGPYRPPHGTEVTHCLHVTVDNVDRHFEHARVAGARVVQPPTDMPFGERQYTALDIGGHWWTFSQHITDLAPEDWGARSAAAR